MHLDSRQQQIPSAFALIALPGANSDGSFSPWPS